MYIGNTSTRILVRDIDGTLIVWLKSGLMTIKDIIIVLQILLHVSVTFQNELKLKKGINANHSNGFWRMFTISLYLTKLRILQHK
ncbi:CLUMA_CG003805, isoform A [Clunio marinus]|uniref:CLUMA_CG003805, isoform A n=1 Tax=Clunio marinus TaxID=568069 RepID=A0A1J1HPV8_9DIPT|nr:CLUMA_CG003805, isoform A [Clunio marinus]